MKINFENDVYLLCLEKGYEVKDEGISYMEMLDHLESKGIEGVRTLSFNLQFYYWFFDNFFHAPIYESRVFKKNLPVFMFRYTWFKKNHLGQEHTNYEHNGQLDEKCPLMYESRSKYIQFLELKSSGKTARWAIWIATVSTLLALIIGVIQIYYSQLTTSGKNQETHQKSTDGIQKTKAIIQSPPAKLSNQSSSNPCDTVCE